MNEGTPADVGEAGLWTALGPDLQQTSKALGLKCDIYMYVSISPGVLLTCMDTCQGQECGLARSPFTMRDMIEGGMAGFPHELGQSGKSELN